MPEATFAPLDTSELLLAMVQGTIVSADEFHVSALDRGLTFGDGVYEVARSYSGRIWGAEQHFARLSRSLVAIGIENVDLTQVRGWVDQAFGAVDRRDCLIYFHITRGCAVRSHVPPDGIAPQFLLMIKPAPDNTEKARTGITAITYPEIRWKRCDIKSLNLLPNVLAKREAYKQGAGEAIFVEDNMITEGASSNVFAVVNGRLLTRPLGPEILPGVTRQAVLAIAKSQGVDTQQRCISLKEAFGADELFVSGSGDEVRSVVGLDGRSIGSGRPGPVARKIIDAFVAHTRSGGSFEELAGQLS